MSVQIWMTNACLGFSFYIHAEFLTGKKFNTRYPYTWLVSLEILFISWIIRYYPTRTTRNMKFIAITDAIYLIMGMYLEVHFLESTKIFIPNTGILKQFVSSSGRTFEFFQSIQFCIVNIVHILSNSHNTRSGHVLKAHTTPS
jgi:hypothetical protein